MKKTDGFVYLSIKEMQKESDNLFTQYGARVRLLNYEYNGVFHIHDFVELELLLSGTAFLQIDENCVRAEAGDCWLCLPGSVHRVNLHQNSRLLSIQFSSDIMEHSLLRQNILVNFAVAHFEEEEKSFFSECVMKFIHTADAEEGTAKLAIKGMAEFLTAYVIAKSEEHRKDILEIQTMHSAVSQAVRYSKFHIAEELTVKKMAELFGYVPNYFSTLFRKEMGISYTAFLTEERLRLANILLKDSDMSILDIAKTTGFDSSAYFCRVYKNTFGITPTEFKKS